MSDQPLPQSGREPVTPRVIEDLQARTERGIATYGRPLESHNGRNALQDLYEELLDAAQYCKQKLMEEAIRPTPVEYDRDAMGRVTFEAAMRVRRISSHSPWEEKPDWVKQIYCYVADAVIAAYEAFRSHEVSSEQS